MKIHRNLIQQSDAWFSIRKGRVTASQAKRIMTPTGKRSAAWHDYAVELMAESLLPDEIPDFIGNAHTERGNMLEPVARDLFGQIHGCKVDTVGFVTRDDGVVGLSPDGLIFDGNKPIAGLEIKAPIGKVHAGYIVEGGLPDAHKLQVHFSMAVMNIPWYFMSYCPGLADYIIKVEPDDFTEQLREAIDDFVVFYAQMRKKWIPKLTP